MNLVERGASVTAERTSRPSVAVGRSDNLSDLAGEVSDLREELAPEQRELLKNGEHLAAALASVQIGLLIIDAGRHTIVEANETAVQMIGAPRSDIVGAVCHQYICPAEVGRCPVTDLGEKADNMEQLLLRADGTAAAVLKTITPITLDGRPHLVECFVDIGSRKEVREALHRRDAILEAVRFAAQRFLRAPSWEGSIEEVLGYLGDATGVSRICVYEARTDNGTVVADGRYAWVATGFTPPDDTPGRPERLRPELPFSRWVGALSRGKVISGRVCELPGVEHRELASRGILSVVTVPVFRGTEWWGYIQFDECALERVWQDSEIEALRAAADTLGAAMQRRAFEDDARRAREAEERAARAKATTMAAVSAFYFALDQHGCVQEWTPATERLLGFSLAGKKGQPFRRMPINWDWGAVDQLMETCWRTWERTSIHTLRLDLDGEETLLRVTAAVVPDQQAPTLVLMGEDVTERRLMEGHLAQVQKLESIGRLAAGIAHEINTPTQYVGDNVRFLLDSFQGLRTLLERYGDIARAAHDGPVPSDVVERVDAAVEAADLEFLLAEIPVALDQTLEGVGRISRIVLAMKEFSHPGVSERTPVDINHAIENTLTVARNEWKYVADMVTDLAPNLPPVPCLPGEFNQVILNLVINAAHAIAEKVRDSGEKGRITVSTQPCGEMVEITVSDTGPGIPEEVQPRIFDPFFTTKEVGKGTGQGLAIARSVVVDKHQGTIEFETTPGEGTTFIIRLSLVPEEEEDEEGPA